MDLSRTLAVRCAAGMMALLVGSMPVSAEPRDSADASAAAYVVDGGFDDVDLDAWPLVEDLAATLADLGLARSDADITALEKALLLIDLAEPPLPRVRYAIRLSQHFEGPVLLSLVEVYRYNLGPAIRAETADAYGEENTADAAVFGIGPHVGWRFAMQPSTKAAAVLLAAGRKELSDAEAEAASCFGRNCLSLATADDLKAWQDMNQPPAALPDLPYAAIVTTDDGDDPQEEEAPAAIALSMAVAMGLATADSDGVLWTAESVDTDSPFIALVIDRNLGQEIMSDSVMGVAKTEKDNEERWLRRIGGFFGGTIDARFQTATGPM